MARQFKVRLFKIRSNHSNIRTDIIEGICKDLPAVGEAFQMFGRGLEFGIRIVTTTPVISASRIDDTFLFKTKNSTYSVLIVEEFDDEAETGSSGDRPGLDNPTPLTNF